MKNIIFVVLFVCLCEQSFSQTDNDVIYPANVEKFISAYPNMVVGYINDSLLLADGKKVLFDDHVSNKTNIELLNNATPNNHFAIPYPKGHINSIAKNHDPGRYRSDELMYAMYGNTQADIEKQLVFINWCPKLIKGKRIAVTRTNNVHIATQKISDELEQHPEWETYINTVQTYNWRQIQNTKRLSPHSFGIAIDVGLNHSHYWLWDHPYATENTDLSYHNSIPYGIVEIFEKHGFIWGGKWYHYDTMHFEYRPELLQTRSH